MRSGNVWNIQVFLDFVLTQFSMNCKVTLENLPAKCSTFVWCVGGAILQEITQCLGLALPDYICTVFTFLNNFFFTNHLFQISVDEATVVCFCCTSVYVPLQFVQLAAKVMYTNSNKSTQKSQH